MRRINVMMLGMLFIASCYFSPDLAAQDLIRTPSVDSILNPAAILGKTHYPRGGTEWYVFSDRDRNPVYSGSTASSGISSRANFLQMFKVQEETNDFVKVVHPDNPANVVGWMKKENLALLSRCIRKANRVAKKAMIINTLENLEKENTSRQFFKDPGLTIPFSEGESINVYTICYVYKETDSTVLLGQREDCSTDVEAYFKEQIFGWIHKKYLTAWDSRGCLQPNYNESAAQIRKSKNAPATLFDDLQWANRYKENTTYSVLSEQARRQQNNPIVWKDDDFLTTSWNPSKFRLPFLSRTDETGVIKVGVLGDIKDESGRAMMKLIESIRDDYTSSTINNLNVVFVIDGTYSMGPYFPAVVDAINQSASRINSNARYSDPDNPNRIIVNWGSVVYRDAPEEDYALETFSLTQNYQQLSSWLGSVFSSAKNANDRDVCEAVYYGLYNALEDVLAEKQDQNNLIILIGDAGDHQREDDWTTITEEEIVESMTRLKAHFIAYQTHYKDPAESGVAGDSSYHDFKNQMHFLAEESARSIYLTSQPGAIRDELSLVDNPSTKTLSLNKNILANTVVYNTGSDMSGPVLTQNIIKSIDKSAENTSVLLSMLYDLLYGGKSWEEIKVKYKITNLTEADFRGLSYIIEQIQDICNCSPDSEEFTQNLEWMLSGKVQMYFEGYAPLKAVNSEFSLWAFDVLASSSSKIQLVRDLRRVERAFVSGGSDNRRQRVLLHTTLIDLARTYAGDSEGDLDNMQIGSLFEQIIDCPGIRFSSNYANVLNMRIRDVELEDRCSVEELRVIYRGVRSARTALEGVTYETYGTRAFKTFTAYWIPIDKFPFMR
ncbi:MAG: VWA domain-containing protein [Bacteroidia bacterium]|nr:VWA domain-containing protein [Bacteroidia bacterium]